MSTPHIKMVNSVYEVESEYKEYPSGHNGDPQPVYMGVGPLISPDNKGGVFLQVQIGDPKGYGKTTDTTQTFKVGTDDIDDLITALQYCKQVSLGLVPEIGERK